MRSSQENGSDGTPTPPKRRNYIIAGTGKLYLEDGSTHPVGPGSVFVLATPMRHDLENTGKETLRAVAFFAAAMFTQDFDQVMLPPKSHILGTPNREG
jgi:oxalate decarboxylase/phosphoglucose isomerase-like protein (cupin superfamily)